MILNSPTTTERDHAVVEYLERVLNLDAAALGREMFEQTADVSDLDAEEIVTRDAKRYQVRGDQEICIAQVEVVGEALRRPPRGAADRATPSSERASHLALYALMITDVIEEGRRRCSSPVTSVRLRAASGSMRLTSTIELPGVMSRKKEVAPKLLNAL